MLRFVLACALALSGLTSSAEAATTWWQVGIPAPARDKVNELANASHTVKKVAFKPGGGWAVLFDTNGFYAQGIGDSAFNALKSAADEGYELRSIAFTKDGGWAMLYGNNGSTYENVPAGLSDRLDALNTDATSEIRDLAIDNEDGWVVVGDHLVYYENIYNSLAEKLNALGAENVAFNAIAMAAGGEFWIVLWNGDKFYHYNFDDASKQKLATMSNDGYALKSFAFPNGPGWIALW